VSNTVIQIKRSHVNATPTVLANGELAYSFQSNNLFIGANSDTNEVPIKPFTPFIKKVFFIFSYISKLNFEYILKYQMIDQV